ncbi:tetratricopeptide repeat protein [Xylophilus sp. GW821-FHT01B05]
MTRPTDSLGNPVTLDDPASVTALNHFVEGFVSCEARAVDVLAAAADLSPIVQACCAALHMFAESREAAHNARPFIEQAQTGQARATPRERRFVAAVAAWVEGDLPRAIALHEEQAHEFPRDLVSVKLGQYHAFNRGDAPAMLRLALAALPAAADVPYVHGMAAFGWEQCHLMRQAEDAARHAIDLCRKEPWAHHALAHVMLTEGRLHEGLGFLREVSDSWTGLNSFMLTHNWWHLALFLLELERYDEALQVYDTQVWGVAPDYSQDQVGAVSLLARFECCGVDVGARWQDVAACMAGRTQDQVLPFLDLQYLYGLARADRPEAGQLLAHIQAHAAKVPEADRGAWQRAGLPTAQGLYAHAQGDYAGAVYHLAPALPVLQDIGGSHAQRDLFAQIYLDALIKSGRLAEAQQLLQPQVNAQPESLRLARQVAAVYAGLGISRASRAWS